MSSPATFSTRELYGGAITASLPTAYIDASDLRQIPDHQELFLSSSTLTSIIFEINEYQIPSAVGVHSNIRRTSTSQADDESASTHHFLDPIADSDHLDPSTGSLTPERVTLLSSSLARYRAYKQTGTILGSEVDRTARSALPMEWAGEVPKKVTETKCYQLLVRLREYGTDLCVRVNVPFGEFVGREEEKAEEERFASRVLGEVIASLEVKDFGLFGTED